MMITPEAIQALKDRLANRRGYFLNPDAEMTDSLLESLLINKDRYGYLFCPCRLATGDYQQDVDLICPCDYRDEDIAAFGTCFCGLYVSQLISKGEKEVEPIPERKGTTPAPKKNWRCTVCGYICVRTSPPDICPICGVTHDRFEQHSF